MKACLLVAFFGCLLAAQTPPAGIPVPGGVTVDGDIVDREGRPIAGAAIELGLARRAQTTSDGSGHFRFNEVEPGPHLLTVSRPGFLVLQGRRITVKPGESAGGIRVALTREGVISGRVTDHGGWPAADASVRASRYETWEGTRQLRAVASEVRTDDLGRYRLNRLPPGRYYVQAEPGSKLARWDERNTRAYYPAALDASEARQATVEEGQVTSGIDIKLMWMEGVQVSGRVATPSGMALQPNMSVMLAREDPAGITNTRYAIVARDGSFKLRHVRPGTYSLQAGLSSFNYNSAAAQSAMGAELKVVVANSDIAGVELALRRLAFAVSGKMAFEGKTEPAATSVILSGTGRAFSAKVRADGTFVIEGVLPGRYRATPWGGGPYVKSVRFGGKEVRGYVDLDGSSAGPLEITVGSGGAKIEGDASDVAGAPVQQAFVVLVEKNAPGSGIRAADPVDQFGRFSRAGIAPGEYLVFAVSESHMLGVVQDPEFLKANADSIRTVKLAEGDNPKLALTVIGR